MRSLIVSQGNDGSGLLVKRLSTDVHGSTTVSDLALLSRVARVIGDAIDVDANWFTCDNFALVTRDGYTFNVTE